MLACDLWPLDLNRDDWFTLSYVFRELREFHLPIMKADKLEYSEPEAEATSGAFATHVSKVFAGVSARGAATKAVEPPTKFELVHIVERIDLFCVGLCLDCFKGNETCRVPHSDPFSEGLWIPLRRMG